MTVDDPDAALAANPATNPTTLAQLAEDRADLRPILAANPGTPYMMLQWLHSLKEPAIDAALRRNGTAVAMGLVPAASPSPWAAPAGGPASDAPPPSAGAPPTLVMPVITPTVPTPITPPAATTSPAPPVVVPVAASVDPTPAAIPRPPDAALVGAGERRRGGFGLVLVMIPLLFLGGCLAALALARGGSDADDATTAARQATTASSPLPTQETAPSTPTTAAAPPLDATTVPATEPAPTDPAPTGPAPTEPPTAAPTPAPAPTVRTPVTTARSTATTVRAATTTRATTATTRAASTTVVRAASGVGGTTTSATPAAVQSFSFTIAQQFASALAAGDWARARTLGPSSSTTDANYRAQYGNLDASTVVPVRATARSVTTYALRIGLVAHETNNGVKQTSLYCAHWDVDTAAGTVTQVDGTKVRTENGTKAASSFTAELTTVCASVTLD